MGWFEDLRNNVGRAVTQNPVVRAVTQSPPARMAGRALKSSYVRPMIGFKPEIGGIILSEFLPKESPAKALVDAGLYLTSGPLNMTLGLGGSTPQGETSTSNWRALGYSSEQDMKNRIAAQMQKDAAELSRKAALRNRLPGVYIADDYGPPRPVRYQDGGVMIGDYAVTRFDTPAQRELAANQPQRNVMPPASTRPVEERRSPVSGQVPPRTTASSGEQTSVAVENELLKRAADQERTAELMRRMIELDVAGGMTADNMRTWVSANPELAQNLIADRLGRKERLAKEFEGFAEYAQ
jgi:hypothetical protein